MEHYSELTEITITIQEFHSGEQKYRVSSLNKSFVKSYLTDVETTYDSTMRLVDTDWLKKLGMSEYAEVFVENRIDFSVLPDLTDQDLEKLGVLLGDRRKILRAIANLDATAATSPAPAPPPQEVAAERRQVKSGSSPAISHSHSCRVNAPQAPFGSRLTV